MVGDIGNGILVTGILGLKLATISVTRQLGRLNNFIPNDHFVALISGSLVLQNQVKVNLLGIPMEKGSEISVQVKTQVSQSNWFIHIRVFNTTEPKEKERILGRESVFELCTGRVCELESQCHAVERSNKRHNWKRQLRPESLKGKKRRNSKRFQIVGQPNALKPTCR